MLEIRQFEEVTQIMMCPDTEARIRYWVSAYVIDGLLIDTGPTHTAPALVHFLEKVPLSWVVNTHHHEDHIGGNCVIGEAFGPEIFAHPLCVPMIESPAELSRYRHEMWGRPSGSKVKPVPAVIKTSNFTFEVMETNGHCPGHICLLEPHRGWLFSGDLYVGRRLNTAGPESSVAETISSMKRLIQHPVERLVLLTSLRTIEREGRKALSAFVDRLEVLVSKASILQDQGRTIHEIVDVLFGGESGYCKTTGGLYSTRRFAEQLLECSRLEERGFRRPFTIGSL